MFITKLFLGLRKYICADVVLPIVEDSKVLKAV